MQAHGVDLRASPLGHCDPKDNSRQHFEDDRSRRVRAVRHHR
ncbi:hypothetical protein ACNKHX_20625 [Shigella flexneri]